MPYESAPWPSSSLSHLLADAIATRNALHTAESNARTLAARLEARLGEIADHPELEEGLTIYGGHVFDYDGEHSPTFRPAHVVPPSQAAEDAVLARVRRVLEPSPDFA